jgi:hypothetical protein
MSQLNLGGSLILDTDYSTSEVKTGATWIDGKPIYMQTFTGTASSTAYTFIDDFAIISNIDTLVDIRGFVGGHPINAMRPASNSTVAAQYTTWVTKGSNGLAYVLGNSVAGSSYRITAWYTKTTD